jgi:DNA-binding response OmpR family regulator
MNEPVILVVDDEARILDTVKAYLERSGFKALCASNGREAQTLLERNAVSLALLDLMLPDVPGEEICRRIRAGAYAGAAPDIPVIMVTAKVDEASIINGLNIGADDYVTKPFSPRELSARISAHLRRAGRAPAGGRLRSGGLEVSLDDRAVYLDGEAVVFTADEFDILRLLMSRPHKVFTRDEIIDRVKTSDFDAFDRVIDAQIKNIRRKLRDDPKSPKYIVTVYGIGYRFGGDAA